MPRRTVTADTRDRHWPQYGWAARLDTLARQGRLLTRSRRLSASAGPGALDHLPSLSAVGVDRFRPAGPVGSRA